MARRARYLRVDVLTAARERMLRLYQEFDVVVISWSGGKDSSVCLELAREAATATRKLPVQVYFQDEEFLPPQVIDFVHQEREANDWMELRWVCVPSMSQRAVLDKTLMYVQWDPARRPDETGKHRWVRDKPPFALGLEYFGLPPDTIISQKVDSGFMMSHGYAGSVVGVIGCRAAESLQRRASSTLALRDNWIFAPDPRSGLRKAWPIYDWEEDDVFRYFYDFDLPYCPVYDDQSWLRIERRVATSIVREQSKTATRLGRFAPEYFERVAEIFPDFKLHARYNPERATGGALDDATLDQYGSSMAGVWDWIEENLSGDPAAFQIAVKRYIEVLAQHERTPERFPPDYVLRCFINQGGQRPILAKNELDGTMTVGEP